MRLSFVDTGRMDSDGNMLIRGVIHPVDQEARRSLKGRAFLSIPFLEEMVPVGLQSKSYFVNVVESDDRSDDQNVTFSFPEKYRANSGALTVPNMGEHETCAPDDAVCIELKEYTDEATREDNIGGG